MAIEYFSDFRTVRLKDGFKFVFKRTGLKLTGAKARLNLYDDSKRLNLVAYNKKLLPVELINQEYEITITENDFDSTTVPYHYANTYYTELIIYNTYSVAQPSECLYSVTSTPPPPIINEVKLGNKGTLNADVQVYNENGQYIVTAIYTLRDSNNQELSSIEKYIGDEENFDNTITFNTLSENYYGDCHITSKTKITVNGTDIFYVNKNGVEVVGKSETVNVPRLEIENVTFSTSDDGWDIVLSHDVTLKEHNGTKNYFVYYIGENIGSNRLYSLEDSLDFLNYATEYNFKIGIFYSGYGRKEQTSSWVKTTPPERPSFRNITTTEDSIKGEWYFPQETNTTKTQVELYKDGNNLRTADFENKNLGAFTFSGLDSGSYELKCKAYKKATSGAMIQCVDGKGNLYEASQTFTIKGTGITAFTWGELVEDNKIKITELQRFYDFINKVRTEKVCITEYLFPILTKNDKFSAANHYNQMVIAIRGCGNGAGGDLKEKNSGDIIIWGDFQLLASEINSVLTT